LLFISLIFQIKVIPVYFEAASAKVAVSLQVTGLDILFARDTVWSASLA
jgi:hypothetical protein